MPPIFPRFKAMLLAKVSNVEGLMRLLMKRRNGQRWTPEERCALVGHLRELAKTIRALLIFSLPGGLLLLPILAWYLDRRKDRLERMQHALLPGGTPGPLIRGGEFKSPGSNGSK
jgi:hypothetical protein